MSSSCGPRHSTRSFTAALKARTTPDVVRTFTSASVSTQPLAPSTQHPAPSTPVVYNVAPIGALMNRRSSRAIAALGVVAAAIATALWLDSPRATAQSRPASAGPVGEWRTYGADL